MRFVFPPLTKRDRQRHCWQWLLLLAAVFGQGRIAEATCGDHLSPAHQATMAQADRSSQAIPGDVTNEPIRIPRCQGPNCRRHEPNPATPSDRVTVSVPIEAAQSPLIEIRCLTDSFHLGRIRFAEIRGPIGRVFRPPRMA